MLLFTVKILKSSNLLHNSWYEGYEYSLILCKLHVHKSFWRTSTTYLMHFYHQIYWTIELPRKWKSEVGTGWYNIQNGQGENRAEWHSILDFNSNRCKRKNKNMDDEEFSSEKNVKVIGIIIFLSTVTEKEHYGSQEFPEKIQNLIFCLFTIPY